MGKTSGVALYIYLALIQPTKRHLVDLDETLGEDGDVHEGLTIVKLGLGMAFGPPGTRSNEMKVVQERRTRSKNAEASRLSYKVGIHGES